MTLGHYQEKKNKLDEQLQNINDCFKRLRDAYTKVEVNSIEESLPPAQVCTYKYMTMKQLMTILLLCEIYNTELWTVV